ncbi:MAG: hypothetical protein CK528_16120 [Alcaligenaceae bacterium]|nr:MAG: hypothetical protein CK528_16120 [Alcaligenaceae bacterium]
MNFTEGYAISHLPFYVPDKIEAQIRIQAERAKLTLSKYLADIIKRETSAQNQWPVGYLELFDVWQGESQTRPPELNLDTRQSFN